MKCGDNLQQNNMGIFDSVVFVMYYIRQEIFCTLQSAEMSQKLSIESFYHSKIHRNHIILR